MTVTASNTVSTACHAYIISPAANDPYEIIPCTGNPSIPLKLSEACAKSRSSCSRGMYCSAHHCAWCKKASSAAGTKRQVGDVSEKVEA